MTSHNNNAALGKLGVLILSRKMLVGVYGRGCQVNMGKKPEHLSNTHELVLYFNRNFFPGVDFVPGFEISSHADLKERRLLISSYPSLYHQPRIKSFGAPFREGPVVLGGRVEFHLLLSVETDMHSRYFVAGDKPYASHNHRATVPVPNTEDDASFALRVLDSIERRLSVSELESGLFLSGSCLLNKASNRYRCCERRGPPAQSADPRREAILRSVANSFLGYRISEDNDRADEAHYSRSQPAHDVIWNHIGPRHSLQHIITRKVEAQWRLAA
ncbi:hypothetical protein Rleg2_2445 [Rhizobium leguminosarum bv. trifolii WSM2304]|uniref:Uncharacterized protein n=1 Tax=Rhizobium leguminosarum bv. trifolii (strain WSM2304) TaxID=395492 RepID=A0ABF7QP49_RHILW|nr:hypothetical protein [Rhizobium leguminosarum]ACI55719.1 hypothetical protein Rleg2_2445 [Rhizobium leguminosarum bv. trifolii WSM2304]